MKQFLDFKPKLLPTLFTIPALILLLGLSSWQFQRLSWKNNLIKQITYQSQLPAETLSEDMDLSSNIYRKVKATGRFLHEDEMYMYGGSIEFKGQNGYYILTPFILNNNEMIIVNRGWVPESLKKPNTRPETLVKGIVEITGTIMKEEEKTLYIHDNQPIHNLWFYINLSEISSFLKNPVADFYILEEFKANTLPVGRNITPNIRNHHLGYALTWLFSAISLLVIYVMYHKKN